MTSISKWRIRLARWLLGGLLPPEPSLHRAHDVEIIIGRDANGGRVWINTEQGCMIRGDRIGRVRMIYCGKELDGWSWHNGRSN